MLISSNFASKTKYSIFALGPQIHQAAPVLEMIPSSIEVFSQIILMFVIKYLF